MDVEEMDIRGRGLKGEDMFLCNAARGARHAERTGCEALELNVTMDGCPIRVTAGRSHG